MLEIIREITLDVSEENRFTAITAKQYDSRSRYLLVRLTDRGEALTLPDTASVLISATRPDGLSDGFEGLVQDGAALVPLDYWMLMLDGTVTCELVVTGADGYRLTTMSFALDVRHSCFGDGLTPGGNHGVYVRLLHEIEDLKKKIGEGLGGSGTVTDEQIYAAVEKHLTEHPIESPGAAESAENAAKSAEEAETSASEAKTAADEAAQQATNAGKSATAASESAANAETSEEAAATSENNAAKSATAASNAATEAQTAQAATEATKAEVERKLAAGDYKGKDGVSPTVTVTSEGEATTIKVVGADGVVQTATIHTPSPQIVMHTAESMEWLEEHGDQSLVYILPDDKKYGYFGTEQASGPVSVTTVPAENCTNDKKLSGSGGTMSASTGGSVIKHIPVSVGDTVTVKGWKGLSGVSSYIIFYTAAEYTSAARICAINLITDDSLGFSTIASNNKWAATKAANEFSFVVNYDDLFVDTGLTSNLPTSEDAFNTVGYIAISGGLWDAEDEIIVTTPASGETVIVGGWQAFGSAIPTERSADIDYLLAESREHDVRIASVEKKLASGNLGDSETFEDALERIKTWDKPVYDDAPVTLLGDDRAKDALTSSDRTIEAIYAKYRALRDDPDHPENALYITETLLGPSTTSSLVPNFAGKDILRFDFVEPVGLTEVDDPSTPKVPDPARETKPKLIFLSGIHKEWAGVYGLYYALEEIATNPDFDDIRRNAHIIVIPCANPFGLIAENTESLNPQNWGAASHVNANGIAPHNNFGVGYVTNQGVVGTYNHSGTEAYSELETQYIDAVMRENSDAIAFVTCHNYNNGGIFGDTVMWASSATYHMCNLVYRLVDKMSKAWIAKYGDTLKQAIDAVKHDVATTDYRLGCATMSTSAGTEQANATKYGVLATNLEISDKWVVFSDTQFSSEAMTHGAEVYANFIRTILRAYDHKDREEYAPTPAYKIKE